MQHGRSSVPNMPYNIYSNVDSIYLSMYLLTRVYNLKRKFGTGRYVKSKEGCFSVEETVMAVDGISPTFDTKNHL